jgi:hypothetical protein
MTNLAIFPPWEPGNFHTLGPAARRFVGRPNRRILSIRVLGDYEYSLHATKGVRCRHNPKTSSGHILAGIMANPYKPDAAPRYAMKVDHAAYMRGGNFKKDTHTNE